MQAGPRLLAFAGVALAVTALIGVSLPPRVEEVHMVDELARVGEPFSLVAKVVGGRLRGTFGGVEGAHVAFEIDGERAGAAETDAAGKATVRFVLRVAGEYDLFARAELPSKAALPLATGIVRVVDADEPIVVTDIDGTLADSSVYGPLFNSPREIRPLPGAVEGLRELARDCVIVYVSQRDEDLEPHTREWLRQREFPSGPVLFSRSLHDPFETASYKRETLRMVKRRFPRILVGIGDSEEDAEAYVAASIPAFLVGKFATPPPGSQVFADWESLVEAVQDLRGRR
ncbi:MAG TPA: phosphatase domain-containing protein [Planctomycetota bacterium]|nr:phosphatase domain-containing protein [Planctomycetota bacterium]